MRSTFSIQDPDKIVATMTLTMPLKEWKQLKEQLSRDWPSYDFSRQISDLVGLAEKQFYAQTPEQV